MVSKQALARVVTHESVLATQNPEHQTQPDSRLFLFKYSEKDSPHSQHLPSNDLILDLRIDLTEMENEETIDRCIEKLHLGGPWNFVETEQQHRLFIIYSIY